jgi:hypothetical protein
MSEILTLSCDKVIVRTSHFVSDKVRGEGYVFSGVSMGMSYMESPPLCFWVPSEVGI